MCFESFILINITLNDKIINLKMYNMFLIFENTFNKKVPLSGNYDMVPRWNQSNWYLTQAKN